MLQVLSDSAIILNRCCLFSFFRCYSSFVFFESLLVTVLDKTDVFVMVVFIIVF